MHPAEFSQLVAVVAAVRPRTMVEWGSGGSTLAIPNTFESIERYISVEHNEGWHQRVTAIVTDPRVTALHRPPHASDPEPEMFGPKGGKTRPEYVDWCARCESDPALMKDYVEAPFSEVDDIDLAFVDGRARVFCIARAWDALRPGGVLVVHDAQRDICKDAVRKLDGVEPVWLEPWSRGQICVAARR